MTRKIFYREEIFRISNLQIKLNVKCLSIFALLIFTLFFSSSKLIAAEQYIPLGDDEAITYNGIPFELYGVGVHVRKTSSEFIPVDTIDLSGYSANKIHLLEAAAFATNVPNGVTVGKIRVYYEDGSFDAIDLIMGFNTAEWAYDRPENQCCLAHNKITPAYSELTNSGSQYFYLRHHFYVYIQTQNKPLDYLELTLDEASYTGQPDCPETCTYYHGLETWFGNSIDAVTLEQDSELTVAHFTADPISGVHPLTVNFSDQSTGNITSWLWDFGDSSNSTDQNPTHTYDDPDIYTVSLTVTGPGGSDTETKTDYIVADYITPIANFTAEPTSGILPLTVIFTDKSTGDITDWLWDFGDDGNSTEQNPTHIYTEEGLYTVTLAVSGPEGVDTEIKTDYIAAYEELTLTNLNSGEIIPSGSYYTVEWVAPFIADNFKLRLSTDNGKAWETIGKGITDTSYEWVVPTPKNNKTKCLVKVMAYDSNGKKIATDKSDAPFTIEVLTVIAPEGGETLTSGSLCTIEWVTQGTRKPIHKVVLKYTKNDGRSWKRIAKIVDDNPGIYPWTVPVVPKIKNNCRVMVVLKNANNQIVGKAMSDDYFTIEP